MSTDPIGTAQERELIERLLRKNSWGTVFINPDGQAAANALQSRIAEVGRLREALADPAAVHVNMLRGTIARPSVRNIWHLYGEEALLAEAPDEVRAALSLQRRV